MYKFSRATAGNFYVHVANVVAGDTHLKKMDHGVTTQNQDTANLYIAGDYTLTDDNGLSERFTQGSCSLDKAIEFTPGAIITETALSDGVRMCVSVIDGKWKRRVEVDSFDAIDGEVLIPLSGTINVGATTINSGEIAVVSGVKAVHVSGRVFVASKVS